MPKSIDQMRAKNNPYEFEVSETIKPDGAKQSNFKTPQGSIQMNQDAMGNVTATENRKMSMQDVMPFVSLRPLQGAIDQIFGTNMAQNLPSQAALIQQQQALAPKEPSELDQINVALKRAQLANVLNPQQPEMTPFQKESLELRQAELAERAEDRALKRQERGIQKDIRKAQVAEKKVENYGKWVEKSGMPEMNATLDKISNIMQNNEDLPGYGATGMLPQFALSREGKDLRSEVANLFNITLKDRSGAAVTDQELNRLKGEFLDGKWMTDQDIRQGIKQYVDRVKEKMRNIDAATPQGVKETYVGNMGRDFSKELGTHKFTYGEDKRKPSMEDIGRRIQELEARRGQ